MSDRYEKAAAVFLGVLLASLFLLVVLLSSLSSERAVQRMEDRCRVTPAGQTCR